MANGVAGPLSRVLEPVQAELDEVDRRITAQTTAFDPAIEGYVAYAIGGGGKRLRPLVALLSGGATGSLGAGHLDLAVNDKTFAYLSIDGEPFSIGCKRPVSARVALMLPFVTPLAAGLGRGGWGTARRADAPVPAGRVTAGLATRGGHRASAAAQGWNGPGATGPKFRPLPRAIVRTRPLVTQAPWDRRVKALVTLRLGCFWLPWAALAMQHVLPPPFFRPRGRSRRPRPPAVLPPWFGGWWR